MKDEGSASDQWVALNPRGAILGAFDSREEAISHYSDSQAVAIGPVSRLVKDRPFVWAVCLKDGQLDSFHGEDAKSATTRAESISGVLKPFVTPEGG